MAPGSISTRHPLIEDAITADEVINTVVFRHSSGLGFGPLKKPEIILCRTHFIHVRESHDADKQLWLQSAQTRYNELVNEMPAGLRRGLGQTDWFATHFKSGPPKITAKTRDVGSHEAIQGVYFFDELG